MEGGAERDTTVGEALGEQPPSSPLNLVSIDEVITNEATKSHPNIEKTTLDMNTIMERLEDPRSASILTSITG